MAGRKNLNRKLLLQDLEDRTVPTGVDPDFEIVSANVSANVAGAYLTGNSDEEIRSAIPSANVAGAFLFSSTGYDETAISFTDVLQGTDPNCAFSASLAAIARTSFNLLSGIQAPASGEFFGDYQIRLYEKVGSNWQEKWLTVSFDNTDNKAQKGDLQRSKDGDIWPLLYYRAYLKLAGVTNGNDLPTAYKTFEMTIPTLTGRESEVLNLTGSDRDQALVLKGTLITGRFVVAGTTANVPNRTVPGQPYLVYEHAFTVLGVDIPSSGNDIYVTLRNPWGKDLDAAAYAVKKPNGTYSFTEQSGAEYEKGLDGNNDGIIRIPWAEFKSLFTNIQKPANWSGFNPINLNSPSLPDRKPEFNKNAPSETVVYEVFAGNKITFNLKATDPEGKTPLYWMALAEKGYINPISGQYLFEAKTADVDWTYRTRVFTGTNKHDITYRDFYIRVRDVVPTVGSVTAFPSIVTTSGADRITITAKNVSTGISSSPVTNVEIYRDANANGVFNPGTDYFVGNAQQTYRNSPDWSWSGNAAGLTAGTVKYFARAVRNAQFDDFYGAAVGVNVTVNLATPPVPFATAISTEISSGTGTMTNGGLTAVNRLTGDSAVFHQLSSNGAIYWKKISAAGTTLYSGQLTGTPAGKLSDVAMSTDGTFAIVTTDDTTSKINLQKYSISGSPYGGGTPTTVFTSTNGFYDGSRYSAKVSMSDTGKLTVTWASGGYFSEDVYYRVYDSSLNPYINATVAHSLTNGRQAAPDVAYVEGVNDFVIAWTDNGNSLVKARRFKYDGTPLGTDISISNSGDFANGELGRGVSVAASSSGSFVVTWEGYVDYNTNPYNYPIRARIVDASNNLVGSPILVNSNVLRERSNPHVGIADTGHFAIAWTDKQHDSGDAPGEGGIYYQFFAPDGSKLGGEISVPSSATYTSGSQSGGYVAMDPDADFVIGWTGTNNSFMRRYKVNIAPTVVAPEVTSVGLNSSVPIKFGFGTSDLDGDALTFTQVNGLALTVGNNLTLPSGAQIVYTASGWRYQPNGSLPVGTTEVLKMTYSDGNGATGTMTANFLIKPRLTVENINPADEDGIIPAGTTSLTIDFTEDVTANAPLQVWGVGPDGLLGTADDQDFVTFVSGFQGINPGVAVKSLPEGLYRLVIPSATDGAGNGLDGNGDGTIGDAYVRDFSVRGTNVVLDGSFGGTGNVSNQFGIGFGGTTGTATAVQADGKIVAVGYAWNNTNYDIVIARYLSNGQLDSSFATNGFARLDYSGAKDDYATGVTIQPDGKIVVAGYTKSTATDSAWVIARYTTTGILDTSFDGDGKALVNIGSLDEVPTGIVANGNKLVLSGYWNQGSNDYAIVTAQLLANGSLDPSFSGDGLAVYNFNTGIDKGYSLAVQPDGNIVVVGQIDQAGDTNTIVLRYTPAGILDSTFGGGDGAFSTTMTTGAESAQGVAIQPDGKIVVAGYARSGAYDVGYVLRLTANASGFDPSFNGIGYNFLGTGAYDDQFQLKDVAILPDGKIIAAGVTGPGGGIALLARYNSNGTKDVTFNGKGWFTPLLNAGLTASFNKLAIESNGRITAIGTNYGLYDQLSLVRISNSGANINLVGAKGSTFTIDPSTTGAGSIQGNSGSSYDFLNKLQVGPSEFAPVAPASERLQVHQATSTATTLNPAASTWVDVPGLTSTFNVEATRWTELSARVLARRPLSGSAYYIRFVIDGVPRTIGSDTAARTGQWETLNLSEWVQFTPGSHTVRVQAFFNATGSVDIDTRSQLRVTESIDPSVGAPTNAYTVPIQGGVSQSRTETAQTWVPVPGLTKTFRFSESHAVTLRALVEGQSAIAQVFGQARFVVDGKVVETQVSKYFPSGTWKAINLDHVIVLGPGQHTVRVEAYWNNGGSITYGNWTNLQVVEQPTAGPGEVGLSTTLVQTEKIGQSTTVTVPVNKWEAIPGLTQTVKITNAQWVNVSTQTGLKTAIGQSLKTRIHIQGYSNAQTTDTAVGEAEMFVLENTWDSLKSNETFLLTPGTYTFTVEGQFSAGSTVEYSTTSKLRVTQYQDLPNASVTDAGRTIVTPAQVLDGLQVTRKTSVLSDTKADVVRTVDIFQNPTQQSITTTARTLGNLKTGQNILATSDGDLLVEPTDYWFVTGSTANQPAVAHLLHGPRGLVPDTVALTGDNLTWTYNLTVPAGQTVRISEYTVLGNTVAEAVSAVSGMLTNVGLTSETLELLDPSEISTLANTPLNSAPTAINLSNSNIPENADPIALIGTLSTDDIDSGETFTYSLVSGTGADDNSSFTLVGNQLKSAISFDFETKNSYSIRVRSTDAGGLSTETVLPISITNVNDAPTINTEPMFILPNVLINSKSNIGQPVAGWLANASDPETPNALSLSITGFGGITGVWERSTTANGPWTSISSASAASPVVLAKTDFIRFTPGKNLTGYASVKFNAYDGSLASSATETAWVPVAVSTPKYDAQSRVILTGTNEDTAAPTATVASTAVGLLSTEFAKGTKLGLAITSTTGDGAWQVKVGTVWQPITGVSETNARLLKSTDSLRFVPALNWSGEATITYRSWKLPLGTNLPTYGTVLVPGDFSTEHLKAVVTVTPINDAPTIDVSLPRIFDTNPKTVANLLQGSSDVDGIAKGIAITRVSAKNGVWQYRTSSGGTFADIKGVAATKGLMLDGNAEIRFLPSAGATISYGSFDYKVIDDSLSFVSGTTKATTTTSFSSIVETGTYSFGNTAPIFKSGLEPKFPNATLTKPSVQTVSALVTRMSDTPGFFKGIAITGYTGTGTWEFSLDAGKTWKNIGDVSANRLLLRSTDKIRFTPSATGSASLIFAAWDQTTGAAGDRLAGTNDSQSTTTLTANLMVT